MHLGAQTRESLQRWAMERGATANSAREVARVLLARFACRPTAAQAARRFLEEAKETFSEELPVAEVVPDEDGTIRFACRLADGQVVEAVAIDHPRRSTVCLSTQAGCARGCVFCETGRLGLARNLEVHEITGQFALVARHLQRLGRAAPTNVVFMGMGEPLDNLDAVLGAAAVLCDDGGFGLAQRRITISTVGVVPRMRELYAHGRYQLAVSLHAANDEERKALLPAARLWDLAQLRAAIADAPSSVLLQWTLIEGVNDDERHIDELAAFCEDLDVRVNLIPLNPGPEEALRAPPMEHIRAIQRRLSRSGIATFVRMPHGQSVGGACGQLAGSLRNAPDRHKALPVVGRARRG